MRSAAAKSRRFTKSWRHYIDARVTVVQAFRHHRCEPEAKPLPGEDKPHPKQMRPEASHRGSLEAQHDVVRRQRCFSCPAPGIPAMRADLRCAVPRLVMQTTWNALEPATREWSATMRTYAQSALGRWRRPWILGTSGIGARPPSLAYRIPPHAQRFVANLEAVRDSLCLDA